MATRDAYLGGGGMTDGSNPFAGGNGGGGVPSAALVPVSAQPAVGFPITLSNGQRVLVASEADYLKLKEWFGQQANNASALGGSSGGFGGGGSANWLRTGGDALDAVSGFLRDRNIRRKMEDIREAMTRATAARETLAQIGQSNATLGPVVNAVLAYADAQNEVNRAALAALDDELSAVDLMTGGAVAKVLADFGVGGGGGGRGFGGGGWGPALAAGGVGLGLGFLLNRSSSTR